MWWGVWKAILDNNQLQLLCLKLTHLLLICFLFGFLVQILEMPQFSSKSLPHTACYHSQSLFSGFIGFFFFFFHLFLLVGGELLYIIYLGLLAPWIMAAGKWTGCCPAHARDPISDGLNSVGHHQGRRAEHSSYVLSKSIYLFFIWYLSIALWFSLSLLDHEFFKGKYHVLVWVSRT